MELGIVGFSIAYARILDSQNLILVIRLDGALIGKALGIFGDRDVDLVG